MQRPSIAGTVILCLFGLPFAGLGLFFAVVSASPPNSGKPNAWIGVALGLLFTCIGFGLMAAALFGYRKAKQQSDLQDANPDTPWIWKPDWAAGRANGSNVNANIVAWVFTAIWDAISFPLAITLLPKLLSQGDLRALLVLIFPLAGIAMTAFAVRGTLRALRYGRTAFCFDSPVFSPGARVKGKIELKAISDLPHGFDLTLSCKRRIVTGSGKQQTVRELVLWQEKKNIPAGFVMRGPAGAQVPVDFSLAPDLYETDDDNPNDRVYWQLHAQADVPGVDFSDDYEIPVFRTQASAVAQPVEAAANVQVAEEPAIDAPAETHIVYRDDGGGPSFYFPPLRNHAQALGVVLFASVWSGVVYFLWHDTRAPWLFRIVFSLFEVLVGYMLLSVVFGSALLRVRDGALEVKNTILGLGSVRRIPFSDVDSIAPLSQGQANTSGTVLYGVLVRRSDAKDFKIAPSSLSEQEAKWVVATLERALGRKQDTHVQFESIYGPPPQHAAWAGSPGTATNLPRPLPVTRSSQRKFAVLGFAVWLLFALPVFRTVIRAFTSSPRPFAGTQRAGAPPNFARVNSSPAQREAEDLLDRALRHDQQAVEAFESKIDGWTGQVHYTDRMRQLEARSRYSRDLRVRQANADLSLAIEGWHRNQHAVDELMRRAQADAAARPSSYYYLGIEGARGVDSQRVFALLSDRALHDPDPVARQWAVEGLRFFNTDAALEVLYQSFTTDPSFTVRDRAGCNVSDCGIFTRAQRMRYVPRLIELSADPTLAPQMRSWTFMALNGITDASVPADTEAWKAWYAQHGEETARQFAALPWYQVRGDE